MKKHLLYTLLATTIFFSCKKKDTPLSSSAAQTLLNINYGNNASTIMDVYLPGNRSADKTPVMILIHGGGWVEGDKSDFKSIVDTMKKRLPDYAIFNINYSLAGNGQNLFPTQEQEVKKCVEFIYNKRSEYKISGNFVMAGASAGGHLVLLQSYKYTAPVKIKAVVDLFGPAELVSLYNNPPNPLIPLLLLNVTGTVPSANPSIYQQSSPYNFIESNSTPTLILHGGNDIVVPASQSVLLKDKLANKGVPHQYVFYPAGGHGDWDAATYTDAFNKIEAFIKTYNP
jgi:acetyl esterase/lipase